MSTGIAAILAGALVAGVLLTGTQAGAAELPDPPFTPLAHSALVTLEGGTTPTGIVLRARHSPDQTPLAVTDLSVRVDGHGQPALRRADGTWFVPLPASARRADAALEVQLTHDGVRELLDGRIARADAAAPGAAPFAVLHDHKQLWWWILNIAVVLIAAIAISRRMS